MFKSEFTTRGTHSYKSFQISDEEMINNYQLSSFEAGDFDFLLPLTTNHKDHQLTFNYEIDSSKSLRKYIEDHGRLSKEDFIKLITDITDVLLYKRQQLSSDYFLVSINDIYFKRNQLSPKFIFLPHKDLKGKTSTQLKDLVLELVPRKVKYSEAEEMYVDILDIFDYKGYSVKGLKEIIDKYSEASHKRKEKKVVKKAANSNNMTSDSHHKPALKSENNNFVKEPVPETPKAAVKKKDNLASAEAHKVLLEEPKEKKDHSKLLLGLLQGITLLMIALIYFSFSDDLFKVVGGSMALLTIDGLLSYLLLKNQSKAAPVSQDKEETKPKKKVVHESISNAPEEYIENTRYKTTFIDERVRLVNSKNKNDIIPVVISANRKFKIGRNNALDLTINKGTVSYEHAELTTDGEKYYLEDLNSTNNTFLNGQKTIGSKKYPINTGDSISFADNEYIFYR